MYLARNSFDTQTVFTFALGLTVSLLWSKFCKKIRTEKLSGSGVLGTRVSDVVIFGALRYRQIRPEWRAMRLVASAVVDNYGIFFQSANPGGFHVGSSSLFYP